MESWFSNDFFNVDYVASAVNLYFIRRRRTIDTASPWCICREHRLWTIDGCMGKRINRQFNHVLYY